MLICNVVVSAGGVDLIGGGRFPLRVRRMAKAAPSAVGEVWRPAGDFLGLADGEECSAKSYDGESHDTLTNGQRHRATSELASGRRVGRDKGRVFRGLCACRLRYVDLWRPAGSVAGHRVWGYESDAWEGAAEPVVDLKSNAAVCPIARHSLLQSRPCGRCVGSEALEV